MINGLVDNVSNFVTCVAEQFVGGLVNSIIGHATNFLKGPLSLVSKILGLAGFPGVGGVLRKGFEALAKLQTYLNVMIKKLAQVKKFKR